MSWDIALSRDGDLIVTPQHALAERTGIDLIEQRIMLRLKLPRGSWVYDPQRRLGSQLYSLTRMSPRQALTVAGSYVREALAGMSEITVDDVAVSSTGSTLLLTITYHLNELIPSVIAGEISAQQVQISVALGGGIE